MIKTALVTEPANVLALESCSRCDRTCRADLLEDHSELAGTKMRPGWLSACCPVCSEWAQDEVEAEEEHARAWGEP